MRISEKQADAVGCFESKIHSGRGLLLFKQLRDNFGLLVRRELLYTSVWGRPSPNNLQQEIASLRRVLEKNPTISLKITTVHGRGYILEEK